MGPGSHVGFPISAKNKNLKMFVFGADRKSNMAARTYNVF
jgi:hypothetical protein